MTADPKHYIDAGRCAMNLLTKRGKWESAPIDPQTPRIVTFTSGQFQIIGRQHGGATAFEISCDGCLCLQGRARINWLTEDDSFELTLTAMDQAARTELANLYDAQLPDGTRV